MFGEWTSVSSQHNVQTFVGKAAEATEWNRPAEMLLRISSHWRASLMSLACQAFSSTGLSTGFARCRTEFATLWRDTSRRPLIWPTDMLVQRTGSAFAW